jgi:predicted acetyltransferase
MLRLRPLTALDEEAFVAGHCAMAEEGFRFALWWEDGLLWEDYLALLDQKRRGLGLGVREVPTALLAADVDGEIVGRASLRFSLNGSLAREGGHIGYGVLAPYRRRGYATAILRDSIEIVEGFGIRPVLVTCNETNVGSVVVIERCGGVFDSTVENDDGVRVRRYWVG